MREKPVKKAMVSTQWDTMPLKEKLGCTLFPDRITRTCYSWKKERSKMVQC